MRSPQTLAYHHQLRCRSRRFSRPQRLTPASSFLAFTPGSTLRSPVSRGFPLHGTDNVAAIDALSTFLVDSLRISTSGPQSFGSREGPLPPTNAGARYPHDLRTVFHHFPVVSVSWLGSARLLQGIHLVSAALSFRRMIQQTFLDLLNPTFFRPLSRSLPEAESVLPCRLTGQALVLEVLPLRD